MAPPSAVQCLVSIFFVWSSLGCTGAARPPVVAVAPRSYEAPLNKVSLSKAVASVPLQSWEEVLPLVQQRNPILQNNRLRVAAQEGVLAQAGLIPNPEVSLQGENLGASNNSASGAETTLLVSQLIERGGKRARRTKAAQASRALANVEAALSNATTLASAKKAYARAVLAQDFVKLARQEQEIAAKEIATLGRQREAGALPLSEVGRASLLQQNAALDFRRAETALTAAYRDLALWWGGQGAEIGALKPFLETPSGERFPRDSLITDAHITRTLQFEQAFWETQVSQARVHIERASAYQDVRVGAGVRRYQQGDGTAFVGEVALPLPLFGNNEGNILFAEREAEAAQFQLAQVQNELLSKARNLETQETLLQRELTTLQAELTRDAERNFRQLREAFAAGRASYLEVLDRYRVWMESRKRTLETKFALQETRIDLDLLLTPSLSESDDDTSKP